MKIIFSTNIDKYRGKFAKDFQIIPRVGEFVEVESNDESLPFNELQVVKVTYINKHDVIVELHLSDLQSRQNLEFKLNVFN